MAHFMNDSVVKYACSCGIVNPISKLFFCRHCRQLRCGFCVCHEVDSNFCSNCLENIPSSEARHKKNCCANCFDCPCCHHTLSARATTVIVQKKPDEISKPESGPKSGEGDGKVTTKKMYYLSCWTCRWTSRDAGIPDQNIATGGWPDNECSYQTRFNNLLKYYRDVVIDDNQEKQEYLKRKTPKNHKFQNLTDRTGLTVSMIRRQMGWTDKTIQKPKTEIAPAIATEEVAELPKDIFTHKINLRNITTIKQRLGQPCDQPFDVNKLYPQRRFLWVKRSLRCRKCEHNVIKPEYNPTSVKYRIQLFANYHMPDILFVRKETSLQPGKLCSVILKFSNPTMNDMPISILNLPSLEEEQQLIEKLKETCVQKDVFLSSITNTDSLKSRVSTTPLTLSRQTSLTEEPRVVGFITNSKIDDSTVYKFVLNQRDDSKEYDEDVQLPEDKEFITWRKGNKVSLRLHFTPDETLKPGDVVQVGFIVQYEYINTVANANEKNEPASHTLSSRVYINIGNISQ